MRSGTPLRSGALRLDPDQLAPDLAGGDHGPGYPSGNIGNSVDREAETVFTKDMTTTQTPEWTTTKAITVGSEVGFNADGFPASKKASRPVTAWRQVESIEGSGWKAITVTGGYVIRCGAATRMWVR